MKQSCIYIIILYIGIVLTGCRDSITLPEEGPRTEAERTVIVYMVADNNLSPAVREDTMEMARGKDFIPENVNFVVYVDDRTHCPAIYELSKKKGIQLWKQYDEELCSTDGGVMLEALSEIVTNFPARHYGIGFWSHATGWTPRRNTFGKDDTRGKNEGPVEMEIPVLRDVLSHLPKLDYIFFDACFMQCIEVAYELREMTDFMVGSPAEIPGPGAPYEKIMEALCKGDAKGIVEGYDSGYPGEYNRYFYPGVLLSCIDCNELEPLAEATGRLLTPFYMERSEPSPAEFQAYCDYLSKYTHYYDMRTTMCRLLSEEDYAEWMVLMDKAVPFRTLSDSHSWFANYCSYSTVRDPSCYSGVSMFVPMKSYDVYGWNEEFRNTSWYDATGWAVTGW